jgi:hypothetical protein
MAISEDLEFQFDTLINTLTYEREYLQLKLQRLNRKLHNEAKPQIEAKQRLRDILEGLHEGQILKKQYKELLGYAHKMASDATDREAKTQAALATIE